MRKLLIFCCCLLLILTCLPAGMAATISGRRYEDFELCYADNLDFINQNTGRHLLPLVLAKGEANADGGHRMYELLGDVLRVTIRLDQSNQIIVLGHFRQHFFCNITRTQDHRNLFAQINDR